MGYLIKSNVINALKEDMHDTMMCYEGKREKDIIAFCYESMEQTIEDLPQYQPDNVFEDTGLTPPEIMELKERDTEKMCKQSIFDHDSITCVCGSDMDKDVEFMFCPWCGQRLKKWED